MSPTRRVCPIGLAVVAFAPFALWPTDEVRADTPEARVKLAWSARNLQVGPGMDARGKRLAGTELVAQDLAGANFDGCDLFHVTLHDCDLTGTSFRGTRFTGCRLWDCTVRGADFTDAVINGIKDCGTYLSERQLKSTLSYKMKDLSQCPISAHEPIGDVCEYDFSGADLTEATLRGGYFTHSDFSDAQIDGLQIRVATLGVAQLTSTRNFKRGRFTGVDISLALRTYDFSGMRFYRVRFLGKSPESDFTDARIPRCSFLHGSITVEQLQQTRDYKEGRLWSVHFGRVDLSGCDFSAVNLSDCSFTDCDFTGANFDDAVISYVRFSYDTRGLTLEQIKSTWNYKHGRMDGIELPEEIAKALEEEQQAEK